MKKNKLFFFLIGILLSVSLTYASSSMGISPPDMTLIYTGEQELRGSFIVHPGGEKNIEISSFGDLSEYIRFDNGEKSVKDHFTTGKEVQFYFNLPKDLKPGQYNTYIRASQYLSQEEKDELGGFGGFAAIAFLIRVRVPNEGKYVETVFSYEPEKVNVGGEVSFKIDLLNFGTLDLTDIAAEVRVLSPDGKLLLEKTTKSIALLRPAERNTLRAYWNAKGNSAGVYNASAIIEYGGKAPAEMNLQVKIGDILIKILNVSTELNESIAKIHVDLESNWNEQITDVYAEIKIKNQSQNIANIRTSAIDLAAWGRGRLTGFWERGVLAPGNYDMEIYVYYFDKQANAQKSVLLPSLEKPSPGITTLGLSGWMIVVIVALVVIFLLNMMWFITNMRRSKEGAKPSPVNSNIQNVRSDSPAKQRTKRK